MPSSEVASHYFIGLFDVLGFEDRFRKHGLEKMFAMYQTLVKQIDRRNAHADALAKAFGIEDGAEWVAGAEAFVFNRVSGAYASDSLVLWAHAYFAPARDIDEVERMRLGQDPAKGWEYKLIPCDPFLEACNELLCHSLEIGLPLRGAVAMGTAILDVERSIFLGQPLIDAARAEKGQSIIGAALTPSFTKQVIPNRFLVPFSDQVKDRCGEYFSGQLLDWPLHWRRTRKEDLGEVVSSLNTKAEVARYYENTLRFIGESEALAAISESRAEDRIRSNYPQFSSPLLEMALRAVSGPHR